MHRSSSYDYRLQRKKGDVVGRVVLVILQQIIGVVVVSSMRIFFFLIHLALSAKPLQLTWEFVIHDGEKKRDGKLRAAKSSEWHRNNSHCFENIYKL